MTWLVNILHVLAYLAPVVTLSALWWYRKKLLVDHVFLFTIGYVMYFLLPITFGKMSIFHSYHNYEDWVNLINGIAPQTWIVYFGVIILLYCSFALGAWLWRSKGVSKVDGIFSYDIRAVNFVWTIGLLYAIWQLLILTPILPMGYAAVTSSPALGTFSAASIWLAACMFVYATRNIKKSTDTISLRDLMFNKFFVTFVIFSVANLILGGRVLVLSVLLSLFALLTVYSKQVNINRVVFGFLAILGIAFYVMALRDNPASIFNDYTHIVYSLFAEPFGLSYSLLDYLNNYSIPLLRFPTSMITSLVGLIPSIFFPTKTSMIMTYQDLGYSIISPYGGMNAFVTFMINFGMVGSALAFFFGSAALTKIMKLRRPPFVAMYVMISGWLSFLLFRDASQAITKEILQYSILIPLFIYFASRILKTHGGQLVKKGNKVD